MSPSAAPLPASCRGASLSDSLDRTAPRHWRRLLGAALFFTLAVALSVARMLQQLDVAGDPADGGPALTDFRDAFYYPGVALLAGHNPYASIDYLRSFPVGAAFPLYSPASLLLHLPFSLLPYREAQIAFVAVNLLVLLGLVGLALRLAQRQVTTAAVLAIAAVVMLTRPGHQNLFLGQCTFYVVAGAYLALLEGRRRPWIAGLGLAIAAIKPTIAVPLALLMIGRGEWPAAWRGGAISVVAAAVMVPPLLTVAGGIDGLLASFEENYRVFLQNPYVDAFISPYRTDLVALSARMVGRPLSGVENIAITAAILSAAAGLVWWRWRRQASEVLTVAVICLALFVCTYHLPYDAVLLLAPVLALLLSPWTMERAGQSPWRWLSLALLAVVAFNFFASVTAIEKLGLSGDWWSLAASATGIASGSLFLIWLGLAAPRSRT